MNPGDRDLLTRTSAAAWADAEPNDGACARRYGVTRRTANRYRHDGPPWLRQAMQQAMRCRDPWRVAGAMLADLKVGTVHKLDTPTLIRRVVELRKAAIRCESEERTMECGSAPWADVAVVLDRCVAVQAERSAVLRELARRRVERPVRWSER